MSESRIEYCLATANPRCDSCVHQRTWLELNQLPDVLRKSLQSGMQRIDSFECDDLDGLHLAMEMP